MMKTLLNRKNGRWILTACLMLGIFSGNVARSQTFNYTTSSSEVTITGYTGTGGNVVIPATIGGFPVTKIADNAFSFRTTLTNITIPDSVLQVGQNAFYGCSGLQTASIGNGVATLPRNAFSECVGLTSVSLGANVKTLGDYAFNNCKKLTSITFPPGFESMGTRAFALCAELTSITFPQSVTAIGGEAFYGCTKLSTVYFQQNTFPTIGGAAFAVITNGAKGYYPATASTAWSGRTITGLSLMALDTQSPVITLLGTNPLEINKGATFLDPGATVTDNVDATRTITGSGTVNTVTVGIYTLTYTATDVAGNLALPVTRTVNVVLDPAGDEDGDGLTNAEEVTRGTNPYQKDSDNDGVNDSKELADGTNPTDASSYKNLSKGLVAYYPFSGNANDSSGNGNSGIPVSPVLSTDRLGASNAAYTFNGTTDRIDLANSAALNMNNGVPFSMSAWIKTDFSDGQRVILAKAAGAWGNTPALFVDSEGKLRFDNFYINEVHSSATVRTGTWMHVAVTYDGSTYRLYVNGVADAEKAFTGSNESGNSWTFSIGGSFNTSFPSGMFKGSIDEVQFWSRTLSPAEVAGVVQASSAPANRAPVIAWQSTTYDALAEFIAGPTLQSANSRWQYLGGNVSALTLLGNWKTAGNEIIQNQSQWDGNSGYLSNYPFVQRVNSATGPTSANTLVIHPSNLEEANRAVAIGWKNTSSQTVAANFNVNLRLPYGSANGIDYKLQRGLAGSSRYLSIRSGSLQAGGSVALASEALVEMQAGEMLYLIVDSKNNFDYDHTEVSAFTVTVAGGANLDSISQGVASANNPGTAVTVLTATSSDADSAALKGIAVTGVDTTHGSWEYTLNGGSVWNSLSGVSLGSARLLKSDGQHRVRFVPTANFSGNAEIRYRAWDQTSGEDGALADLTGVGGGAWILVAYGANASLGGFLTGPSGSFSSSVRSGSAVLPGALDILKNSSELAMTWTASGGSFPSGGTGSYTHGIAFALPNAAGMSFDGAATSPLIYNNGANPLDSSFAVGSSNPDQSLVNVRTLVGSPGMPSQMYLRNKTFGAGYGSVYGVVMNNGSNPQLDYGQVPDGQTFKAVYLDHGTGAAQGQGLVMGGAGGAQNSYVPSTMAIWARLDSLQLLALSENSPVSGSGNYLLNGIGTTYVDVIDFDSSGAFSANTATGTIVVNPVPVTITAPESISGMVGTVFQQTVTASGSGPIFYSAINLPAGLTIHPTSGVIIGSPTVAGSGTASIVASNTGGLVSCNVSWTIAKGIPTISALPGFMSATGGTISRSGDFIIHTFRNVGSYTFQPMGSGTVEILVVAGGGGGGGSYVGGGGGGGGVLTSSNYSVAAGQSIAVQVGSGGAGSAYGTRGQNGGSSSFGNSVASGGGGGGTYGPNSGLSGGSGGGAGWQGVPGTGVSSQGNNGGTFGGSPNNHGGGGGGASGTPDSSGVGGPGIPSSISGSISYYGGGGSAGTDDSVRLAGGIGGGGQGGAGASNGTDGADNTGGGGGGGGGLSQAPVGGRGGSGIVIVRYRSQILTYGQSIAAATFSGATASVSGFFAFTSPSTTPAVGSSSQSVTFTPTDTYNYETVTTSVRVFVVQATPTILTLPTSSTIVYGQTLSSSGLSGGEASVQGTFTWANPMTAPAVGTSSQSVTFSPSDSANYETVTTLASVTAIDPDLPVANEDAFTAKLAAGMTTKVTTASLISNDKYSGIPAETRGVTFQGAATTSTKGATIEVKAGWLIYRPSSSAQNGTSDTFTYTVSNGIKTATGTVRVSLVAPDYVVRVAIDRVDGNNVYFSVMPGMTFEVQGTSQLGTGATWTTIAGPNSGYWTSGADGRLVVTDPAAVGAASRFYKFRWIP